MPRAAASILLAIAFAACACRASESKATPSPLFAAHHPERIRALAPIDRVGTESGAAVVRKCVERQLRERGYSAQRAGRTATLHVVIERWGRVADGSGGGQVPCAALSARLYDDATGALIWQAGAESGCEPDEEFDEDEGWLERVLSSLVDWTVDALTNDLDSTGEDAVKSLLRSLPRAARTGRAS
jgi:hypothetical protein